MAWCGTWKTLGVVVLGALVSLPLWAQDQDRYSLATWAQDVRATPWTSGGAFAGITALGLSSWDWGNKPTFSSNPEGWFGKTTGSGGADKLDHSFTSYTLTNVLADQLVRSGRSRERAALSAALTAQALMLYSEMFDGFSGDHGFAREDVVMNLLGSSFAYARTVSPWLHGWVDFRLEYKPSGFRGVRPLSDRAGKKYLLAFKLAGSEALRDTPLRFVELQAGYFTRGFSRAERADGIVRSRNTFVGVGLNLTELLFGRRTAPEPDLTNAGRLFFEHVQVPYTAVRSAHSF